MNQCTENLYKWNKNCSLWLSSSLSVNYTRAGLLYFQMLLATTTVLNDTIKVEFSCIEETMAWFWFWFLDYKSAGSGSLVCLLLLIVFMHSMAYERKKKTLGAICFRWNRSQLIISLGQCFLLIQGCFALLLFKDWSHIKQNGAFLLELWISRYFVLDF